MAINRVAKGRRIEKLAEKSLKGQGYSTYRPTWSRFGQKDIFGLFDIICVRTDSLLLVQVKTNRVAKDVVELISNFEVPSGVAKQIWVYHGRGKFEILNV